MVRLAGRGNLTRPPTLFQAHKVVAVAMTTAEPEVRALGGDDVVVVAGFPGAAGAGGARQRADGALDCREETAINCLGAFNVSCTQ